MTLMEVLITIAIIGLISSAAAFGLAHVWTQAQIDTAQQNAERIRAQSVLWRQQHNSQECPTFQRLIQDKIMDKASKPSDPWGTAYVIVCEDEDTSVVSWGRDKREGTSDDIRVPSKN